MNACMCLCVYCLAKMGLAGVMGSQQVVGM